MAPITALAHSHAWPHTVFCASLSPRNFDEWRCFCLFLLYGFIIGWGLGLGQLPDFYHFSAITGSCQIFTILEQI